MTHTVQMQDRWSVFLRSIRKRWAKPWMGLLDRTSQLFLLNVLFLLALSNRVLPGQFCSWNLGGSQQTCGDGLKYLSGHSQCLYLTHAHPQALSIARSIISEIWPRPDLRIASPSGEVLCSGLGVTTLFLAWMSWYVWPLPWSPTASWLHSVGCKSKKKQDQCVYLGWMPKYRYSISSQVSHGISVLKNKVFFS